MQNKSLWALPLMTCLCAALLGGCCEEQETSDLADGGAAPQAEGDKAQGDRAEAPEGDKAPAEGDKAEGDRAKAPEGDADAGDKAEGEEPPIDNDDPRNMPGKIDRDEDRLEAVGKLLKLDASQGWEHDLLDASGSDLAVAIQEGSKGASPAFRAALLQGDTILDETTDFKAFLNLGDDLANEFKDCLTWATSPMTPLTFGETRALKISFWCNLEEDPPITKEIVAILKPNADKPGKLSDFTVLWSGLGGSSSQSGDCALTNEAFFTALDEKTLQREIKPTAFPITTGPEEGEDDSANVIDVADVEDKGEPENPCKTPKGKIDKFTLL